MINPWGDIRIARPSRGDCVVKGTNIAKARCDPLLSQGRYHCRRAHTVQLAHYGRRSEYTVLNILIGDLKTLTLPGQRHLSYNLGHAAQGPLHLARDFTNCLSREATGPKPDLCNPWAGFAAHAELPLKLALSFLSWLNCWEDRGSILRPKKGLQGKKR